MKSQLDDKSVPRVSVETDFGSLVVALYPERAPASCHYLLSLVDRGVFDPCSIFRIVTDANHAMANVPPVHALQLGHPCSNPDTPVIIPHEHTKLTGLQHHRGVVSLPRWRPGATYESFFICYDDAPSLDFGGIRTLDGQGFAAFGELVAGWDVIDQIVQQSEAKEYLEYPLQVMRIRRIGATMT